MALYKKRNSCYLALLKREQHTCSMFTTEGGMAKPKDIWQYIYICFHK